MPKKLILTVDDEPLVTRLVQVNLERAGYEIRIANNGIDALELMRNESLKPDLILLDVMMPYMDGFELLSQLKADDQFKAIPIVMLTVRSRDADIVHGQAEGVAHYLTKPIHPNELLGIVEKVIGPADAAESA